jgi:hypothetical protein
LLTDANAKGVNPVTLLDQAQYDRRRRRTLARISQRPGVVSEEAKTARSIDPREAELVARLRARDVTAPSALAETYLPEVARRLAREFPTTDEHLATTAAIDAILNVAERPDQVDLSKGTLRTYLVMAARGDLRNVLATATRRRGRESSLEAVEVLALERKIHRDDPNADPTAEAAIQSADRPDLQANVRRVTKHPTDAAVLKAMLEGERRTAAYAEILGISGLDEATQRAEVKKVKDRLKLRLRRTRAPES